MNAAMQIAVGWLIPGGAYLLTRRYLQFAMFACAVTAACVAGLVMQGGTGWPQPGDLSGVDGFTALLFRAGAATKLLAGGPYLLAQGFGGSGSFLSSRVHEFGSTLLVMAGTLNLLAVSSALDLHKEDAR